ncbi:MAG: SBBP repeat-containing protein [Bacteroidetes bacterium]|nr:SBBP repeat-containing protein [Bacteroidota bacterium]
MLVKAYLISQPICSNFSTYFGGNQFDEIKSVCVDVDKNSYVIGNTYSNDLPVTLGLINDTASGNYDVFLAKFDSCGALIWSTYFGGIGYESAEKMELTHDGNIVFCGYTTSVTTPTTLGCFQANNNGGYDCYLTKITPNGLIVWSTFFGKSGGDFAFDLKIDAVDNIIIGGTSTSTNLYTTPSSFQPNHKGNTDAFIARFSKNGLLKWCTYYGGAGSEDIHALAVDLNCNIIGVGESFSNNLNTSTTAFQSINEGASDTYIIKLDSTCNRVFSTYLGGSGSDDAWGLVCDSLDNIYVAGHTNSLDFDTTAFTYQTTHNGGIDCYLTKWSPTGTLIKSTLFGGALNDYSSRLIGISNTELLLLTETESINLPTYTFSQQTSLMGSYDMYLTSFDMNTLFPTWGTYNGGAIVEDATDIKLINSNEVVVCGSSNSTDYPVSSGANQPLLNNSTDGVITKLTITKNLSTVIENKYLESTIEIYPNPFSDYLFIKSKKPLLIEIKTLLGETIYSRTNDDYISTKDLSPGVYIVTANSKSYRFIKQ